MQENCLNLVVVEGYLTDDVKLERDGGKNKAVYRAKFYLLNPVQIGRNKYKNEYYVVVYGKKAEKCAQNLCKGKRCKVVGKEAHWFKKDKMGNVDKTGVTVIADDIFYDFEDDYSTAFVDADYEDYR